MRLGFARARLREQLGFSSARSIVPDHVRLQSQIVNGAHLVFPNSQAEKQHLLDRFPDLQASRLHVVYNGVDPVSFPATRSSEFFLCAGAVGPRKNQLNLVKAFRQLPHERLIVLGKTAPNCDKYRRAVERAAGANVEFHDAVPHERMADYWLRTKVLVQPSYIETPGLSALEAAAGDVPVVVSDVPPVREYFAGAAYYCQPGSPQSIARACVAAAQGGPRGADLSQRFSWQRVLEPLCHAYAELEAEFSSTSGQSHVQSEPRPSGSGGGA
jgi:glycosyltransferase involved in cell wall biosynthesis